MIMKTTMLSYRTFHLISNNSKFNCFSLHSFQGLSALMLSVQEGHWDTAKFLLEQQAAIEQTDNVGRTPLMIASAEGHVAIVELLLDKGYR